jgi:hypothetical protein
MRQTGYQVNIDVVYPGCTESRQIIQDLKAFVKPADGSSFAINEGLHAQAYSVHTAFQKQVQHGWRERSRSTLDGNFRIVL